jgi:hypothetical protein
MPKKSLYASERQVLMLLFYETCTSVFAVKLTGLLIIYVGCADIWNVESR